MGAEVGAPIPQEKRQGDTIMGPAPTDVGEKKSSPTRNAVKFVEENLNDSMPITSTALGVWRESPSAPHATNLLICLLVMAVESLSTKVGGGSFDTLYAAKSKD